MDEESFEKALNAQSIVEIGDNSSSIEFENFAEWLSRNENRLFRFWVYRRIFTPYEKEEKFMDESIYEDDYCELAYIKEAIKLPDNDILLGFQNANFGKDYIEYYKLSEIRLAYMADDKDAVAEEGIRRT